MPNFGGQTPLLQFPEPPAVTSPKPASTPLHVAAWRIVPAEPPIILRGGAVHHSIKAEKAGERITFHLVLFDSKGYQLKVLDQPVAAAGGRAIADVMRANQAAAGINGGFFTPEFTPLGLMISSGRITGAYQPSTLLTGLILTRGNLPQLIWNSEFHGQDGVSELLQAGPRLVDSGQIIRGLKAEPRRDRSFIASDGGTQWVLGTSSSCGLATLADLLANRELIPGVRLFRALNLDGGNSTAIWFQAADGRKISSPGWSTVRNYLAIIPNPS